MRCHRRHRDASGDAAAPEADGGASTSMMALALFAGVVAGAALAQSWYRDAQARRRHGEKRERIERWEGEGGALPGTVGTGGSANPPPSA
ncbi:MAG: hypothetical protein H3C59_04195 [Burkholderiaceae bacterium]|nr:hypothetical protein [Burkholderiaceae bacterium]